MSTPFLEQFYKPKREPYQYIDKKFQGTDEEFKELLNKSTTLYVGEVCPAIKEECIWELFSLVGPVKRVIMGINRNDRRPCGFCFVEYYTRKDAENCVKFISGFRLDGHFLKCDIDHGYCEGRELGRGESGGQVKDEFKKRRIGKPMNRYNDNHKRFRGN
ncbi:hypothetical protein EDEG_01398 [Edhazardia aedis USNM 41457]|uniref:Nuclear cap-binding protein subunit 2 n=1 Tax=Edhazardia aedis (strain USNM 41457) TaxID=1003232 RepID=J9DSP0_EDHAE|nr:hypothetical protein EDEG_01398 [Edhazardia aedis USNM 41457]|eukprot:EJW04342.1 hypothetical protein EDEG_01398 [Edhazardia aedis USNM 41457]